MRLSLKEKVILCLCLIAMLVLTGCASSPEQVAVSTPLSAANFALTPTPVPTAAPTPTEIPTPEPTEIPTKEPTPEPTPSPSSIPVPTPFTIAWMTDTQALSRLYPDIFNSMRDWILEHREEYNIVFFVHSGDVVDAQSQEMWHNAETALTPIVETIPGMIASGNHDLGKNNDHYWFSQRSYTKHVYVEGQTYGKAEAAYTVLEAAGDTFLFLGIGYRVFGRVDAWVERIISEHPGAIVIYVLHFGIEEAGNLSGQAKYLFNSSIQSTPTARLMLSGHMRGSVRRTDWFDDDGDGVKERSFTTMMFNYQDDYKEGLGYFRLLTFYPDDRHIEVRTYSPYYDSWHYAKSEEGDDAFILPDAF